MNNLFESVVLGHQSPHHLRQSYGDLGETIGEGCQQPLGLVEPLLSSSVVGQTQEVGRRHRVSARLSSILIWSNTHGGGGGDNTLLWYSILAGSTPCVNTLQSNQLPRQALQKTDGRGSSSGFYVFVVFFFSHLTHWMECFPKSVWCMYGFISIWETGHWKKSTTEDDERGLLPVTFKWDEQNVFVINWVFY